MMKLTKKARKELKEILMDMELASEVGIYPSSKQNKDKKDVAKSKKRRDEKLEVAIRKMSHFLITY